MLSGRSFAAAMWRRVPAPPGSFYPTIGQSNLLSCRRLKDVFFIIFFFQFCTVFTLTTLNCVYFIINYRRYNSETMVINITINTFLCKSLHFGHKYFRLSVDNQLNIMSIRFSIKKKKKKSRD